MIQLFINALAASAGGGLTYIRNLVPLLAQRDDVRTTLLVGDKLREEISESPAIKVVTAPNRGGSGGRFVYEQRILPAVIRQSSADVLLSTGNFALFRSPVPQILLSRNALYLSSDFSRDLRQRGDYRLLLDTKIKGTLARWSVQRADCTVAPSHTFSEELHTWTAKPVVCIHHGFDPDRFFRNSSPLSPAIQASLDNSSNALRILFVSHYNYYRNFETLIRAIAIAKERLKPRPVRLFLTCKLSPNENPGTYEPQTASKLISKLNLRDDVVELGSVPYSSLHHLYRACNVYATPAYAETFAHPLVEAMASGLPIVASDLGVHREICGPAAVYFPRFSPEVLAAKLAELSESNSRRTTLREAGLLRSRDFRWHKHADQIIQLARQLLQSK